MCKNLKKVGDCDVAGVGVGRHQLQQVEGEGWGSPNDVASGLSVSPSPSLSRSLYHTQTISFTMVGR